MSQPGLWGDKDMILLTHDGSMVLLYMVAYIPAPWILWVMLFFVFCWGVCNVLIHLSMFLYPSNAASSLTRA